MRKAGWRNRCLVAIAAGTASVCAAANAEPSSHVFPSDTYQVASRDMLEHYYRAYRLIGSQVLSLDGERIGEIANLVLTGRGDVSEILLQLYGSFDTDGEPIAVSPHRFEIVSTDGTRVIVLRTDLTHEEIVQAQLLRLKSNARAPAEREAGPPDMHRELGPFY